MKKTEVRWRVSIVVVIALVAMAGAVAMAEGYEPQGAQTGQLKVSGDVKVDGQDATSGQTINSGTVQTTQRSSAVVSLGKLGRVEVKPGSNVKVSLDNASINLETAANSSAVVSLGKLGRVEVRENTALKLSGDAGGVTVMLEAGRVRLSSGSGTYATVSTKDGEVATAGANEFEVDLTCGNTVVSVQSGTAELRAGGSTTQVTSAKRASGHSKGRCRIRINLFLVLCACSLFDLVFGHCTLDTNN